MKPTLNSGAAQFWRYLLSRTNNYLKNKNTHQKYKIDLIGKPPIIAPIYILGKLSMFICWMFPLLKFLNIKMIPYTNILVNSIALVLLLVASGFIIPSFVALGQSISMGLPTVETKLKIDGIYRISRNPMYVGFGLMCISSCLYIPNIINFVCGAITIFVHHKIILAEEKFLEKRFNEQWKEYKKRVRRYL